MISFCCGDFSARLPGKRGQDTRKRKADTGRKSLNLRLYKTTELLDRVEASVDEEDERYRKIREYKSQPDSEKLKACNFPARKIQIGYWERTASNDIDIVVKFYFSKKQIVWEVLVDKMKKKIEISWNDISSLRATFAEGKPSTLHIELNVPPNFFDELDPQPRRHPTWMTTQDFTGGEALRCRRHTLTFSEGILEKHYEKFVHSNGWLFHKHQRPFPVHNSNLFEVVQRSDTPLNHQQYAFNLTYERAIRAQQSKLKVPPLRPLQLHPRRPFPRPVMGNIDLSCPAIHYAHHNMAMDSMPHVSVNRGQVVSVKAPSTTTPNVYPRRVGIDPRTQYCALNQTLHANAIPADSSLNEGFSMSNTGEYNLCGSSSLMSTGAYNQNEAHGNPTGEGISLRNSTDFNHANRLPEDLFLMNDDYHNLDS